MNRYQIRKRKGKIQLAIFYISPAKRFFFLFQDGDNLLHVSARGGHLNIVKLLLERTKIDLNKDNRVRNIVRQRNAKFFFNRL